jgi:hypothetical protein
MLQESEQAVLSIQGQKFVITIHQAVAPCRGSSCRPRRVLPHNGAERLAENVLDFREALQWHCVNVGSKEVLDSLFLVACVSLGMDCLHRGWMCADADNPTARTR